MRIAYVDTSALIAIAFGEASATRLGEQLRTAEELFSSTLLEAELRAAFAREEVAFDEDVLTSIGWIMPTRRLTREIEIVLAAGYLRGADLWHVANALYLATRPDDIAFVTMDTRQREVAGELGFNV